MDRPLTLNFFKHTLERVKMGYKHLKGIRPQLNF